MGKTCRGAATGNRPGLPDIRLRGRKHPMRLDRVTSGDTLLTTVGPTLSFAYEPPPRITREQRARRAVPPILP
jgi:hypothetical protein